MDGIAAIKVLRGIETTVGAASTSLTRALDEGSMTEVFVSNRNSAAELLSGAATRLEDVASVLPKHQPYAMSESELVGVGEAATRNATLLRDMAVKVKADTLPVFHQNTIARVLDDTSYGVDALLRSL
jgi:hypothetical protein